MGKRQWHVAMHVAMERGRTRDSTEVMGVGEGCSELGNMSMLRRDGKVIFSILELLQPLPTPSPHIPPAIPKMLPGHEIILAQNSYGML